MDVLSFFERSAPVQRVILPSAQVNGVLDVENPYQAEQQYIDETYADDNTDYAAKYMKEEEELCLKMASTTVEVGDMERPDTPTSLGTMLDDKEFEAFGKFNETYNIDRKIKADLAIFDFKDAIERSIESNGVIVIQGPTGCGKTTQVPQFILDLWYSRRKHCKIAVAQPRRLAAISVAKRVSEERGWSLGSVVGYQVGLDNTASENTVITYMTTGVLLQKLINQKNMNQYTHIILDEIHERNLEMDFLLLLVRKFFRSNSRQVKVILMSATIDVDHFAQYFSVPLGNKLSTAVVIDVNKRQPHIVNIYYLNDFMQLLNRQVINFNRDEPGVHESLYKVVPQLLSCFDEMDLRKETKGSVLIFLPGIHEIEDLYELLKEHNKGVIKWFIVPLHSSITVDEQRRAFEIPQEGYRKIILSTNIAESSVTVPDVVYVIDFCLTKMMICDTRTNYSSLKLEWASKTNCEQRAGRVGRVASGKVYRMVPKTFYDNEMDLRQVPEMLRCPLHRLVLYVKMLEFDNTPHALLALALDPPNLSGVDQAILLLKEIGALRITTKGYYDRQNGDLTYLGSIMGHIPLDLHAAKLIALGYLFGCSHETIIIAAGTVFNIFSSPFNERMKAYMSKLSWADGSCSDLIAYLHVYSVWERNRVGNLFGPGGEKAWMKRNFLQPKVMKEWRNLIIDIKYRLQNLGLTEPIEGRATTMSENEKGMMIKIAVCGAYYPNYFVRSSEGGQVDESLAVRTVGGRDPYTTVYFNGKPQNQPGPIYSQAIRELLKECGQNVQLSFDQSSKIYVQFKRDMIRDKTRTKFSAIIPGKIPLEVYRAVKYRQLKLPSVIHCLPPLEAEKRLLQWQNQRKLVKALVTEKNLSIKSVMPCAETTFLQIEIVHINDPGHFYIHNVGDHTIPITVEKIFNILNNDELNVVSEQPGVGMLYAALYENSYYRARVLSLVPTRNECRVQVVFIDYGNTACVPVSELREIPFSVPVFPPLAIECVLMGVQPSLTMNAHALWDDKAKEYFERITNGKKLYGKIYSVVDDVVSLELLIESKNNVSVNQQLIEKKFAEPAEESFLSKDNHKRREDAQAHVSNAVVHDYYEIEWFDQQNEITAPSRHECRTTFELRGPYSPLEMKVYSLTQCSQNKTVSIEWSSVNSVLLDTDPQNPHDRLLVSAVVGQNIDGTHLNLRHTTLMPNMFGFPAMMVMLFCIRMDIHVDKDATRVTSILCGLGCDEVTKKSYYPGHDVVVNLDFELTYEDITFINELRYFMNLGIQAMSFKNSMQPKMSVETCQNEIRSRIRKMFRKVHKSVDREILPNSHVWGNNPPNLQIIRPEYVDDSHDIWPMHSGVQLRDPITAKMKSHVADMYNMANNTIPVSEITCKLCDVTLYTALEIRIHIVSKRHKEREKLNEV